MQSVEQNSYPLSKRNSNAFKGGANRTKVLDNLQEKLVLHQIKSPNGKYMNLKTNSKRLSSRDKLQYSNRYKYS